MKKFVQENFTVIVLVIAMLSFLKSCSDSRRISGIEKKMQHLVDSTYNKIELNKRLQVEGLKAEKRMIQATDRKILDVNRQTEIDNEIKKIENQ